VDGVEGAAGAHRDPACLGGELHGVLEQVDLGIPKAALPKLGYPFEQVETNFARSYKGSGLGLATAAVELGERAGDGEAEAGALVAAGEVGLDLLERVTCSRTP
jgi:hypothetical protein